MMIKIGEREREREKEGARDSCSYLCFIYIEEKGEGEANIG